MTFADVGQRFLITGALGAIGVWTMRSLLERGHEVVAFDLGGPRHRLALALTLDEQELVTHRDGGRGRASAVSHPVRRTDPAAAHR